MAVGNSLLGPVAGAGAAAGVDCRSRIIIYDEYDYIKMWQWATHYWVQWRVQGLRLVPTVGATWRTAAAGRATVMQLRSRK